MKKTLLSIAIACLMLASATQSEAQTMFKSYKKEVSATSRDGAPAGLTLKLDIPQGQGVRQTKITQGIKTIIQQSEVNQELKRPVNTTLQAFANALAVYFPTGIRRGTIDIGGPTSFDLIIAKEYQNTYAVFFHVVDGVYGNGGPSESYQIVRVSDGKVLEMNAITKMSIDDLVKFLKKYGTAEQKDFDPAFLMGVYYLCPSDDKCKVLYLQGAHFWETLEVPMTEIEPLLTEEGKKCFAKQEATATTTTYKVGRGELGIFDLRGPVKSFVFKNQWGSTTRTFDRNGKWLTHNGKTLRQVYPSGIRRDAKGRITMGIFDADGNCEQYFYNEKGLITKRIYGYFDSSEEDTYTYDANGNLLKMKVEEGGMDASEPYTNVYTTITTDKYGNWIKRKNQNGEIETRTITYYQ
ncbi:MAG: hypothetical protein IJ633_04380 [Prevotella sp.]|nr:hypothetical protein [Prevotella sp.]